MKYPLSTTGNRRTRNTAYIDYNGFITDSTIYHGEEPHGTNWIRCKLINLLRKHQNTNHIIPIMTIAYNDYKPKDIKLHYKEATGMQHIKLIQETHEGGEFGLLNYTLFLPLWYIVYILLNNNNNNIKMNKDYSSLSTKELISLLQDQEEKDTYINHDIFMLNLITGNVMNIGS